MIDKENIEKKMGALDLLLEMMGGDEDSPLEMKLMLKDRKATKLFQEIMTNEEFMKLEDDTDIKQALLDLKNKEIEILEQIKSKLS